ncbi:MAG: hypothetical protein WA960_01160 [Tunicatimonas sp.]
MIKYILPISLFGLLLLPPLVAPAQPLNAADTAEIRQKAGRHVRQFEGLLNLISQPDEYFRKYGFDALVRSYYDEQSGYQIFRDSLVVVEDDLNPRARVQRYGHLLTIQEYLKAFFSLYEKSPVTSVFFDRYRVSEVKQGDFTYVEVRYDSEFRNRHRAFPEVPYPVRARKATVKAERTTSGWQVIITDLSYDRPATPQAPVTVASSKFPARRVASTSPTAPEPSLESPRQVRTVSAPAPASDITLITEAASENPFGSLRRVYRPGKTYQLPLLSQATASDASLLLYQNDQLVEDISAVLTDSTYAWPVPKQLPSGGNYQLRRYDPVTETTAASMPFTIRRRARWPWVVGAVAAAAVVVAIITSGDETASSDELPAPPAPN